jgi:hypothetical protein
MSLETTLQRISQIQSYLDPTAAARAAAVRQAALVGAVSNASASGALNSTASAVPGAGTTAPAAAGAANFANVLNNAVDPTSPKAQQMVAAAKSQMGVAEQPPGSNESPEIAEFRKAVEGAPGPGPWCAYYVSWAAKQAGTPLGDRGEGFASVDAAYAWAQRAGKAVPNGAGVKPNVGDLIVFDEHIGIVTGVKPDGTVQTIEGNTSDKVAERTHPAGAALGYIRLS